MKKMKKLLALLLCVGTLLPLTSAVPVTASAPSAPTGAMVAIREAFDGDYLVGSTVRLDSDGYIGIPVELTTYVDRTKEIRTGINGSPVILYLVNTALERVGTKSDCEIIRGMLDRGFVVIVTDYLGSPKAVSPGLDFSTKELRLRVYNGEFFDGTVLRKGSGLYYENFLVPAGCDIEWGIVYWEIDKHGADGTLERIVEVWNNDFKNYKKNVIVNWLDAAGNRKKTTDDAVWTTESTIALKYTVAESIYDCVKPDGSPLDFNLYMHIVYPTDPVGEVPVYVLGSSHEGLADAWWDSNPHMSGFLFRGYAIAMFDYAYVPMARTDHYNYFDGSGLKFGAVTGDNKTFSVSVFNEKYNNTAAIRMIRYLAVAERDKYKFALDRIGVMGGSKSGPLTYLGEPHPEEMTHACLLPGHHGETRYDNGKTEDDSFGIIDGGEPQPWLTYPDGTGIPSNINFCYTNVGSQSETISRDHCPTYVTGSMAEGHVGYYTNLVNGCRLGDTPCLYFEIPTLGHAMCVGVDLEYGIESYDTLFDFADYYLRGTAAKCMYISVESSKVAGTLFRTTDPVTVKFTGVIAEEEIRKVTFVSGGSGRTATGTWESSFGGTEWTFTPDGFEGGVTYTVTVPDSIVDANNGLRLASSHTATFTTAFEVTQAALSVSGTTVSRTETTDKGVYFVFDRIDPLESPTAALRFFIGNEASNTALLFAVESYNAADPDASVTGRLVGHVKITGSGFYEIDISDELARFAGKQTVAFLLKAEQTGKTVETCNLDFDSGSPGHLTLLNYAVGGVTDGINSTPGGSGSLAIEYVGTNAGVYKNTYSGNGLYPFDHYVSCNAIQPLLSTSKAFFDHPVSADDLGRVFHVSMKVYDTVSRRVRVVVSDASASGNIDMDFTYVIERTEAGKWTTIEFDYILRDPAYGGQGIGRSKTLTVAFESFGGDRTVLPGEDVCLNPLQPIYFDDIIVTETITGLTVDATNHRPSVVLHPADGRLAAEPVRTEVGEGMFTLTYPVAADADIATLAVTADGSVTDLAVYALKSEFSPSWKLLLYGDTALKQIRGGTSGMVTVNVGDYLAYRADQPAVFLVTYGSLTGGLDASLKLYRCQSVLSVTDSPGFTLDAALAAAKGRTGTVRLSLGADASTGGTMEVPSGARLIVDTNGYRLTAPGIMVAEGAAFVIRGDSADAASRCLSCPAGYDLICSPDAGITAVSAGLRNLSASLVFDGTVCLDLVLPSDVRSVNGQIFTPADAENGQIRYRLTGISPSVREIPLVLTYEERGCMYSWSRTLPLAELLLGAMEKADAKTLAVLNAFAAYAAAFGDLGDPALSAHIGAAVLPDEAGLTADAEKASLADAGKLAGIALLYGAEAGYRLWLDAAFTGSVTATVGGRTLAMTEPETDAATGKKITSVYLPVSDMSEPITFTLSGGEGTATYHPAAFLMRKTTARDRATALALLGYANAARAYEEP